MGRKRVPQPGDENLSNWAKHRKKGQDRYRAKVKNFTFQFSLKDKEAQDWFEAQENKGAYLKQLILEDKYRRLAHEE